MFQQDAGLGDSGREQLELGLNRGAVQGARDERWDVLTAQLVDQELKAVGTPVLAVGAGLGLAVQADMRIFSTEAKYGFLQARRGVVTDFAMEYVLPRLVGFEQAFELLVRGHKLSGEEAVSIGLAGRHAPADDVLNIAMEIAREIAINCAPLPVGLHKSLLWRGQDVSMAELAKLESRALKLSMSKADAVEGGLAYLERRQPKWTGSIAFVAGVILD